MAETTGRTVAFLLDDGYEDSELTAPWDAVTEAGATATLVSPKDGSVEARRAVRSSSTRPLRTSPLPTSTRSCCQTESSTPTACAWTAPRSRSCANVIDQGKPIGVIYHGAWILIEAGAVRGREITSYPCCA